MLQTLKNAWRTKDIKSKIIFTLFILVLYRIGTVIPVPFVNASDFNNTIQSQGTILSYLDILSGGSLANATIFALGVSPYINSSIIIQLLAVVFPRLGEIAKEDKDKMNFITRIVTVILAVVTALGYYFLLRNNDALTHAATPGNTNLAWFYGIAIVACYVAGASVIMWLAERINERGIGNGISMILFANIVSTIPKLIMDLGTVVVRTFKYDTKAWLYSSIAIIFALAVLAYLFATVVFIVWVTGSERRIPVQYAKRVVGRKMYGGQSSNIPLKLNMTGVMPVIFASSIVSLVPTILALCGVTGEGKGFWNWLTRFLAADGFVYPTLLFVLIIAFAYFYTQITFDPTEVSNNLKKQGGAIPGIRQGRPTADYIRKILGKVTLVGALFLGIIAVLPVILGPHVMHHIIEWLVTPFCEPYLEANGTFDIYHYFGITIDPATKASMIAEQAENFASSYTSTFTFGGTSILIIVGVAIETFRELEAQLTMRNYKGFL